MARLVATERSELGSVWHICIVLGVDRHKRNHAAVIVGCDQREAVISNVLCKTVGALAMAVIGVGL